MSVVVAKGRRCGFNEDHFRRPGHLLWHMGDPATAGSGIAKSLKGGSVFSGLMEHVIRRLYFRAKIAERLGDRVDRRRAKAAFMQAVRAAEKVARYRQAQLSAINSPATSMPR